MDFLELVKAYGRKDINKLTRKVITDKNGHQRVVYVKNGKEIEKVKARFSISDMLKTFLQSFGIGMNKINDTYNTISADFDVDRNTYIQHLYHYLKNKDKFDKIFSQSSKKKTSSGTKAPKKKPSTAKKTSPKKAGKKKITVKKHELNMALMRRIAEIYGNVEKKTLANTGKQSYNKDSEQGTNADNSNKEADYDFERIQTESRRLLPEQVELFHRGSTQLDEGIRRRLSRVFSDEIKRSCNLHGNGSTSLVNPKTNADVKIIEKVDGKLFHDIFEINQKYLFSGDAVDVHSTDFYQNTNNYISDDGLSGFSVTKDGNLVSVFNLGQKGFLKTIKDYVKSKGVKTLDCYNSKMQDLPQIYEATLGFKTVAILDFNYDILAESKGKDYADSFVNTYGKADVAFMVNTDSDVEEKHFNKDQYDEAKAYQVECVNKKAASEKPFDSKVKWGEIVRLKDGRTGKVTGFIFKNKKTVGARVNIDGKTEDVLFTEEQQAHENRSNAMKGNDNAKGRKSDDITDFKQGVKVHVLDDDKTGVVAEVYKPYEDKRGFVGSAYVTVQYDDGTRRLSRLENMLILDDKSEAKKQTPKEEPKGKRTSKKKEKSNKKEKAPKLDYKATQHGFKGKDGKLIKVSYGTPYDDGSIHIFDKGWGRFELAFLNTKDDQVENDSDSMTDYFEQDSITVTKTNPYYKDIVVSSFKQNSADIVRNQNAAERKRDEILEQMQGKEKNVEPLSPEAKEKLENAYTETMEWLNALKPNHYYTIFPAGYKKAYSGMSPEEKLYIIKYFTRRKATEYFGGWNMRRFHATSNKAKGFSEKQLDEFINEKQGVNNNADRSQELAKLSSDIINYSKKYKVMMNDYIAKTGFDKDEFKALVEGKKTVKKSWCYFDKQGKFYMSKSAIATWNKYYGQN